MTGWDFAGVVAAALVLLGWVGTEAVLARDRIATRLRDLAG